MENSEPIRNEVKSETRLQNSMRGILRWVLVGLLTFGLGALLVALMLYIPTRQQLDNATTGLAQANTMATSQADQITTLQTSNTGLQRDLDSATLHTYVLKALSGVRGASQAVATGDYAGARLLLIEASAALDTLPTLMGTNQKDVLTAMQQSAAQVLTLVKTTNLESAQPELEQLTKNLAQLEGNLFPNP